MKSAIQKERELIIKLHKEKKTCRQIASILGISKSKTSFWIVRYKETKSLENMPRSGRPTLLTKEKLAVLASLLKEKMVSQEQKPGLFSKEVLVEVEAETGKKYTLRHAQRLLHKMGFSLITPRVSHIRKDEKAQEKFRVEFKKNLNGNMWVIQ